MALSYTLLETRRLVEFEQERITETKEVVNENNEVVEQTTLIQEGFKIWVDANIYQENGSYEGLSRNHATAIKVELVSHSESTDNDYSVTISPYRAANSAPYPAGRNDHYKIAVTDISIYNDVPGHKYGYINRDKAYTSKRATTSTFNNLSSQTLEERVYETLETGVYGSGAIGVDIDGGVNRSSYIYYNTDGTASVKLITDIKVSVQGITGGIFKDSGGYAVTVGTYQQGWDTLNLNPINKAATILAADNFTDEENPVVAFQPAPTWTSGNTYESLFWRNLCSTKSEDGYDWYLFYTDITDYPTSTQICISLDGVNPLIPYRDITTTGSYIFNLTEAERETLRINAQGSNIIPIYFIIKVNRRVQKTDNSTMYYSTTLYTVVKRSLTIVSCNPSVNPMVKDIKSETLALTGNENTVVRYESMVEYAINAVASKNATIVSQSVTCGSKTVSDLPYGIIDDVESGLFIFKAIDSRNLIVEQPLQKNLIEYVKPTCFQKVEVELSGETGATMALTITGSYFNGSFGAANNTLKLEVRYTQNDGTMGNWITLTGTPVFNGNTYTLETTISGFSYDRSYTFQCRATDKLNTVQSSQYTLRVLPVFDWGEEDFNFNVPVNVNGELSMNKETVLRYNEASKNTVVSAGGGSIYFRPGGTDDTFTECVISPDGDLAIAGALSLGGNTLADYVIEIGETAMGTNGTWYWTKWASGKAECYGTRNFGNMAVTTAWGSLFRSAALTQTLPTGLFSTTPDLIQINLIDSNYGGWIAKHETSAPSNSSTGSFIVVRPASATITPSDISFHIIGRW